MASLSMFEEQAGRPGPPNGGAQECSKEQIIKFHGSGSHSRFPHVTGQGALGGSL